MPYCFPFPRFCGLLAWLLLLQASAYGQDSPPAAYTGSREMQPLSHHLSILKDPAGAYSPQQAFAHTGFVQNRASVPNLNVSSSVFWIKFQIQNRSQTEQLVLKLAQPHIDNIVFYQPLANGTLAAEKAGLMYPYWQRKYDSPHFLFNIRLGKGQTGTYLLRLQTTGQLQVPLSVGSQQSVYESVKREDLYIGLYAGIILSMFLYNLFLFSTLRSRSYLYYVANVFTVGLTQVTFQGYAYKFLWFDSPWMATHSLTILTAIAGISSMSFIRVFLRLNRFSSRLDMGMKIFIFSYIPMILLGILGFESASYQITRIASLLSVGYTLFVVCAVFRKGSRTAGFLLLAWSVFLAGICVFALKDFGILPYNDFTNNTMLIGSAAEMLLLSFALADRINKLKKEKEHSQQRMLAALRANEKFVQEENMRLEAKVRERTRELEESAEELNTALSHLKDTQGQLLHAEKMASLGQLTAGVAHEINNPINFVSASIKPLRRDVKYLWQLITKQENALKNAQHTAQIADLEAFKQKVDIGYLQEEIELLLKGVEDGASRTTAIVRGLRNFSRLDDEELRPVSLAEGLDSTLLLLSHSLKDDVTVEKDYALNNEVECYPGKMNQVFMNVLSNAIHAVKLSNHPPRTGIISLSTRQFGQYAVIRIKDNGIGMPEATKNKIFDPFFTTKDVGAGTGLGLSIVFGIVKSHGGQLKVNSAEGCGTEFEITLPLVYAGGPAVLA